MSLWWPNIDGSVALFVRKIRRSLTSSTETIATKNIEPSASPFNSPNFVIHKRQNKFHCYMISGAQVLLGKQWDSPSQSFLILLTPQKYYIIIRVLKDCFFLYCLKPDRKKRSSFSVPTLNNQQQWFIINGRSYQKR